MPPRTKAKIGYNSKLNYLQYKTIPQIPGKVTPEQLQKGVTEQQQEDKLHLTVNRQERFSHVIKILKRFLKKNTLCYSRRNEEARKEIIVIEGTP